MTDHPVPDHGAETEMSRLYVAADYDTAGLIPFDGKLEFAPGGEWEMLPGVGDMVVFFPWYNFDALDGDPTQVEAVEVFPHYAMRAPRCQDPQIVNTSYFPRGRWSPSDTRVVAHPTAAYRRTSRMLTLWQGYLLQDLRTDPHPLTAPSAAPNPMTTLKPTFWEVACGDEVFVGLWFHSVGGDAVPPVLRAGEYFRLAVAFGGMGRTY